MAIDNLPFGLEHPLLAVHDLDAAIETFRCMGFSPSPIGRHPWGTTNSLVMFPANFVELISVGDPDRVDDPVNADGFRFGRVIADVLAQREGLSMTALHSKDAAGDHATVLGRDGPSKGLVDFRRPVRLPDGHMDEAVVSLAMLLEDSHPNVGYFLCHQHKPDLVWVPDWLHQPNGVDKVLGTIICADRPADLAPFHASVFGDEAVSASDERVLVKAPVRTVEIITPDAMANRFSGIQVSPPRPEDRPVGVALRLRAPDLGRLIGCLEEGGSAFAECRDRTGGGNRAVIRIAAPDAHGTILEFVEGED